MVMCFQLLVGPVVTSSELFNDTGSVKLKAGKVSSATNQGTI